MQVKASTTLIPARSQVSPVSASTLPSQAPPRGDKRAATRRRPRILFAEDDADLRFALKTRLHHHGYDVSVVFDGVSARCSLLSCRYDAVVLDLGLPKSHGLDVMLDVAKRKKLPPVVVLTGSDEHEQDLALTLGADLVLQKPCPFEDLSAALDSLLNR